MHSTVFQIKLDVHQVQQHNQHLDFENQNLQMSLRLQHTSKINPTPYQISDEISLSDENSQHSPYRKVPDPHCHGRGQDSSASISDALYSHQHRTPTVSRSAYTLLPPSEKGIIYTTHSSYQLVIHQLPHPGRDHSSASAFPQFS